MSASEVSASQAIDFLTLAQSLKVAIVPPSLRVAKFDWPERAIDHAVVQLTKRTGWIRMGIDGPESIADHMYRMSLMALIAGDVGVDANR